MNDYIPYIASCEGTNPAYNLMTCIKRNTDDMVEIVNDVRSGNCYLFLSNILTIL